MACCGRSRVSCVMSDCDFAIHASCLKCHNLLAEKKTTKDNFTCNSVKYQLSIPELHKLRSMETSNFGESLSAQSGNLAVSEMVNDRLESVTRTAVMNTNLNLMSLVTTSNSRRNYSCSIKRSLMYTNKRSKSSKSQSKLKANEYNINLATRNSLLYGDSGKLRSNTIPNKIYIYDS